MSLDNNKVKEALELANERSEKYGSKKAGVLSVDETVKEDVLDVIKKEYEKGIQYVNTVRLDGKLKHDYNVVGRALKALSIEGYLQIYREGNNRNVYKITMEND